MMIMYSVLSPAAAFVVVPVGTKVGATVGRGVAKVVATGLALGVKTGSLKSLRMLLSSFLLTPIVTVNFWFAPKSRLDQLAVMSEDTLPGFGDIETTPLA